MKDDTFMDVNDIMELTKMSEAYAYKLIKTLNEELDKQGFITIRGRVSKKYFEERVYGVRKDD